MKIIIGREASPKTRKLMTDQFPQEWEIITVRGDDLIKEIKDADIIIPEGTVIDGRLLKQAKKLKFIQTGAGHDNVDIEACTERGILVANAAGINAQADGVFFHKKRFQFFAANIRRVVDGKAPQNALNELPGLKTEADRLIPEVILPEGYNGKILLVSVSGEGIKKTVLLRAGDLWHREILRNTETELKNLGYDNAGVHELGGAQVCFEPDGTIAIYGASEEFGACDKAFAAEMIRNAFPGKDVSVRD